MNCIYKYKIMKMNELLFEGSIPFVFKKGAILCQRLGPINAQKQTHKDFNPAPNGINRGMWAFPYPFYEPFLTSHIITKSLPKKFQNSNDDKDVFYNEDGSYNKEVFDAWCDEYHANFKKQKKRNPIRRFYWSKPLFARFGEAHRYHSNGWYYYETPKEYAEYARRHLPNNNKFEDGKRYVPHYSKDYMELFLPMKAGI